MSADSPRRGTIARASGGSGGHAVPAIVPPQVVSDRSILDSAIGFINDVTLANQQHTDPKDTINWARFETMADISDPRHGEDWELEGNVAPPLLLILGYGMGVQVWAIPANGEAIEVLSWRHGIVTALRVLPTPTTLEEDLERAHEPMDAFAEKRPLMAMCDGQSVSASGSLGSQQQFCAVNFVSLKTAMQVKAIKFKNPVLDILANRSSVVITFHERIAVFDARTLEDRLSITTCYPSPGIYPNPVALGPRWLAFAENKLMHSKRSGGGCDGEGVASYTATVLNAAKSLSKGLRELGEQVAAGLTGTSAGSGSISKNSSFESGSSADLKQPGIVSIMDIKYPLRDISPTTGTPISLNGTDPYVAHFVAHSEALVAMEFDNSGMLLLTADKRGHDFHVFRIQPHPVGSSLCAVHHLYVLHRGDTSAKVQNIAFSLDSRWVAVSTLRGTTHVFPITPYGGPMGVRTHTSLHVVNKLSRFHRSAGLSADGRSNSPITHSESTTFSLSMMPYNNPTLPPYPRATVVQPLAQLRQPMQLSPPPGTVAPSKATSSNASSSQRQRLSSLSDDNGKPLSVCAIFAKSRAWLLDPPNATREAPHRMQRKSVDSLFVMAGHGALIQYDLDTKLASNVAKEKICDDTPIELEVEAKAQWNLVRRDANQEIMPPLSLDNWLIKNRNSCTLMDSTRHFNDADDRGDSWLAQVEIITHAGPHRRLWMGPQFVFKTYNTPSGSNLNHIEAEAEDLCPPNSSALARSDRSSPLNMPLTAAARSAVPVLIESGSYSSIEQSPKLMDRFCHEHLNSDFNVAQGDSRLKEDLADAMRETPSVASMQPRDAGRVLVTDVVGCSSDNAPFYDALNDCFEEDAYDLQRDCSAMALASALPNISSYGACLQTSPSPTSSCSSTKKTASIEKVVNPLGTVTTITAGMTAEVNTDILDEVVSRLAAEESVIHENCDEALFRPVVAIFCDEKTRLASNEEARRLNEELCKPPELIGNKLIVPVIAKERDAELSRKERLKKAGGTLAAANRRIQEQRLREEQLRFDELAEKSKKKNATTTTAKETTPMLNTPTPKNADLNEKANDSSSQCNVSDEKQHTQAASDKSNAKSKNDKPAKETKEKSEEVIKPYETKTMENLLKMQVKKTLDDKANLTATKLNLELKTENQTDEKRTAKGSNNRSTIAEVKSVAENTTAAKNSTASVIKPSTAKTIEVSALKMPAGRQPKEAITVVRDEQSSNNVATQNVIKGFQAELVKADKADATDLEIEIIHASDSTRKQNTKLKPSKSTSNSEAEEIVDVPNNTRKGNAKWRRRQRRQNKSESNSEAEEIVEMSVQTKKKPSLTKPDSNSETDELIVLKGGRCIKNVSSSGDENATWREVEQKRRGTNAVMQLCSMSNTQDKQDDLSMFTSFSETKEKRSENSGTDWNINEWVQSSSDSWSELVKMKPTEIKPLEAEPEDNEEKIFESIQKIREEIAIARKRQQQPYKRECEADSVLSRKRVLAFFEAHQNLELQKLEAEIRLSKSTEPAAEKDAKKVITVTEQAKLASKLAHEDCDRLSRTQDVVDGVKVKHALIYAALENEQKPHEKQKITTTKNELKPSLLLDQDLELLTPPLDCAAALKVQESKNLKLFKITAKNTDGQLSSPEQDTPEKKTDSSTINAKQEIAKSHGYSSTSSASEEVIMLPFEEENKKMNRKQRRKKRQQLEQQKQQEKEEQKDNCFILSIANDGDTSRNQIDKSPNEREEKATDNNAGRIKEEGKTDNGRSDKHFGAEKHDVKNYEVENNETFDDEKGDANKDQDQNYINDSNENYDHEQNQEYDIGKDADEDGDYNNVEEDAYEVGGDENEDSEINEEDVDENEHNEEDDENDYNHEYDEEEDNDHQDEDDDDDDRHHQDEDYDDDDGHHHEQDDDGNNDYEEEEEEEELNDDNNYTEENDENEENYEEDENYSNQESEHHDEEEDSDNNDVEGEANVQIVEQDEELRPLISMSDSDMDHFANPRCQNADVAIEMEGIYNDVAECASAVTIYNKYKPTHNTTTDSEGPLPGTTTSDDNHVCIAGGSTAHTSHMVTGHKMKTKKLEHKINLIGAIEAATSSSTSSAEEEGGVEGVEVNAGIGKVGGGVVGASLSFVRSLIVSDSEANAADMNLLSQTNPMVASASAINTGSLKQTNPNAVQHCGLKKKTKRRRR